MKKYEKHNKNNKFKSNKRTRNQKRYDEEFRAKKTLEIEEALNLQRQAQTQSPAKEPTHELNDACTHPPFKIRGYQYDSESKKYFKNEKIGLIKSLPTKQFTSTFHSNDLSYSLFTNILMRQIQPTRENSHLSFAKFIQLSLAPMPEQFVSDESKNHSFSYHNLYGLSFANNSAIQFRNPDFTPIFYDEPGWRRIQWNSSSSTPLLGIINNALIAPHCSISIIAHNQNTCRIDYGQVLNSFFSVDWFEDSSKMIVGCECGLLILHCEQGILKYHLTQKSPASSVVSINRIDANNFICGQRGGKIKLFDVRSPFQNVEIGTMKYCISHIWTTCGGNNIISKDISGLINIFDRRFNKCDIPLHSINTVSNKCAGYNNSAFWICPDESAVITSDPSTSKVEIWSLRASYLKIGEIPFSNNQRNQEPITIVGNAYGLDGNCCEFWQHRFPIISASTEYQYPPTHFQCDWKGFCVYQNNILYNIASTEEYV